MSQPLKPGENEIVIRLVVSDRDYDDLEAYAKVLGKTLNGMLGELIPAQHTVDSALASYREIRQIALEEARTGKVGEQLAQAIKKRVDAARGYK